MLKTAARYKKLYINFFVKIFTFREILSIFGFRKFFRVSAIRIVIWIRTSIRLPVQYEHKKREFFRRPEIFEKPQNFFFGKIPHISVRIRTIVRKFVQSVQSVITIRTTVTILQKIEFCRFFLKS